MRIKYKKKGSPIISFSVNFAFLLFLVMSSLISNSFSANSSLGKMKIYDRYIYDWEYVKHVTDMLDEL